MLEPGRLALLPLLETTLEPPTVEPAGAVGMIAQSTDLLWRTTRPPATRLRVQARAWLEVRHGATADPIALRDMVDLPPGRNPRTLAWAAALRRDPRFAEADARTLSAEVLDHLRRGGFGYTLAPGPYGLDAVDEFWLDRRLGFCEHFAAAFVVVMRALDVPARIVTGYQGADPTPVDGWWVVRQSHAHAWAEIWQDGLGWLRVDQTAAVAPERVARSLALRPPPGVLGQVLGGVDADLRRQLRRVWERMEQHWGRWVLGWSGTQQMGLLRSLGIPTPDMATLARVLVGLLATLAAGVAAWAWWDRGRRDPWAALLAWERERLRRLGVTVADHDPPRRRALAVRAQLGPDGEGLATLLLDLERWRYGGREQAPEGLPPGWRQAFAGECRRLARTGAGARRPPPAEPVPPRGLGGTLALALAACLASLAATPASQVHAQGTVGATADAPSTARPLPSKQPAGARGTSPRPPDAATGALADRAEVRRFAEKVAARRGWDPAWVLAQLASARLSPRVRELIMPPPPGRLRDWAAYRARFVEPGRIEAGAAFWQAHRTRLERAQARWGVPAWLVVGIIGVETHYGRFTGGFRALDALATFAFDFPPGRSDRSDFFRSELVELLALTRHEGIDAASWRGSFAGALGLPQFMPGSVNRWAVDFDDDGRIDLRDSAADAIGSVAHYLAGHGWQVGLATHHGVQPPPEGPDREALLAPDIVPSFTAAQLRAHGARLDAAAQAHDADRDGLLALVQLDNGARAPSFVAGTRNFFVVTRYNRSSYYALAVIELGQAVREAMR